MKVQYQNPVFTKAMLFRIQEFRMPAIGKIVRDTPPEKLLIGEPVSMIFCLKNKECIEMELSGGQVRISREDDIAFIDAVAKVVEENKVYVSKGAYQQ